MGGGGAKTHEAFTVTPTLDDEATDEQTDDADGTETASLPVNAGAIVHDLETATDLAGLQAAAAVAAGELAHNDPTTSPAVAAVWDQVHAAANAWITNHYDTDALVAAASSAGLEHAEYVPESLADWLNPTYPDDGPHKAKIAVIAAQRHAADSAGIGEPINDDAWHATAGDVIEAQAAFAAALTDLQTVGFYSNDTVDKISAVIAAENKLATATCPYAPEALAAAVKSAKDALDATLAKEQYAARQWVHAAIEAGTLPAGADNLAPLDAIALHRATTSKAEHSALQAAHQQRTNDTTTLKALGAELATIGNPPNLEATDIATFAKLAGDYYTMRGNVAAWAHSATTNPLHGKQSASAQDVATGFRTAAKKRTLTELRAAAKTMGLDPTAAATGSRAQIQNWIIGTWNSAHDQSAIASAIAAQAAVKTASKKPTPSPLSTVAPSAGNSTVSPTAGSGKWHGKKCQLVAAIKHHVASTSDVPARVDPHEVASWKFTDGPSLPLGGMHTKSVHTAPDGSHWMFKPDKNAGGARATAETTANKILNRVGIPTIPVYERSIGGKAGTIQPLLDGAVPLSANPSNWSQADVDAIVRYHVAAWVVGDHDAKHDNLLRTPNGGLVPIDHGQAFKFYGRDRLAADFHPNGSFGAAPPVWNALYNAAKNGGLAPGVKVRATAATPVIKAFEAMPDSELSAMLKPAAVSGAGNPAIHWRDTMTKRAAKKYATTKPTDEQVADTFIASGLERKHSLRGAFISLFTDNGIEGSDVLSKVA